MSAKKSIILVCSIFVGMIVMFIIAGNVMKYRNYKNNIGYTDMWSMGTYEKWVDYRWADEELLAEGLVSALKHENRKLLWEHNEITVNTIIGLEVYIELDISKFETVEEINECEARIKEAMTEIPYDNGKSISEFETEIRKVIPEIVDWNNQGVRHSHEANGIVEDWIEYEEEKSRVLIIIKDLLNSGELDLQNINNML